MLELLCFSTIRISTIAVPSLSFDDMGGELKIGVARFDQGGGFQKKKRGKNENMFEIKERSLKIFTTSLESLLPKDTWSKSREKGEQSGVKDIEAKKNDNGQRRD